METSTGSGGGGKRRRIVPSSGGGGRLGINSLTEDVVVAISEYLPKTSRALLAVALTAPSSSWRARAWMGESVRPCAATAAIVASEKRDSSFASLVENLRREDNTYGYNPNKPLLRHELHKPWLGVKEALEAQLGEYYEGRWELLDFVDVGKSLASRLTDDDLGAVLACIDAKNNLKRLKLTHCFNIVGHGLDILRTSKVEKIDMSLVRTFEQPTAFVHAKMSEDAVLPVIDDIIGREGNAFRRLQVPKHWLKSTPRERSPPRETSERLLRFMRDHGFLMVRASCCCYFGFEGLGSQHRLLAHLGISEGNTDSVDMCPRCGTTEGFGVCGNGCGFICCKRCEGIRKCCRCLIRKCNECNNNEKMWNPIIACDDYGSYSCCEEDYCKECLFITCRKGANNCEGCKGRAFDRLKEESDVQLGEIGRLRAEVKRLRQREMDTKVAVRRLAGEVKTLEKAYGQTR